MLSTDIIEKINFDFKGDADRAETFIKKLIMDGGMKGTEQFIRSLIFLANGNFDQLRSLRLSIDDPRDLIMRDEEAAGNPGHYFIIPFSEMDSFSGELPNNDSSWIENNDLSF
jgi:hypothetical protein